MVFLNVLIIVFLIVCAIAIGKVKDLIGAVESFVSRAVTVGAG